MHLQQTHTPSPKAQNHIGMQLLTVLEDYFLIQQGGKEIATTTVKQQITLCLRQNRTKHLIPKCIPIQTNTYHHKMAMILNTNFSNNQITTSGDEVNWKLREKNFICAMWWILYHLICIKFKHGLISWMACMHQRCTHNSYRNWMRNN